MNDQFKPDLIQQLEAKQESIDELETDYQSACEMLTYACDQNEQLRAQKANLQDELDQARARIQELEEQNHGTL